MNSLIFLAISAFVTVSGETTCDDCLSFCGKLGADFLTDTSIAEQIEIITANICPGADDPVGCTAGITTWWADIIRAMDPVFLEPNMICAELGACSALRTFTGEATCDDCLAGVEGVAAIISSEKKIAEIIEFLNGDGFCTGTGDTATCSSAITGTMPYVMPVLAGALVERETRLCCELTDAGLCC